MSVEPPFPSPRGQGPDRPERTRWATVGAPLLAVAAVIALVLGTLLGWMAFAPRHPGDGSAEAGFARDMSEHHAQAVEMSLLVMQRSEDSSIRTLTYDIATSQANQIGQMEGWIRQWGLPMARPGDRMEWMGGHEGHDMAMADDGSAMPGMATPAEMDRLRAAEGEQAEILFLQLMTTHHLAGVDMAQAAVDLVEDPEVDRMARAMALAQASEIDLMTELLADRDSAPREDLSSEDADEQDD